MSSPRVAWSAALGAIAAGLVGMAPAPVLAQYLLSPGDVIEISAAGVPDLRQRAPVNIDGEVALPLLGRIKVSGRPLSDLRAKVEELLPTKAFRRRTPEGRDYPIVIAPDEITVSIVEYRPVYLNGDVSKPGEQVFRPGMTVRQAVALAGGYDIMRFRMNNPFLEASDLRSEYDSLWTEFAKEQAHVFRLQAELENRPDFDRTELLKTPISQSVATRIITLEADQLKARNTDFDLERQHLRQAIEQETKRYDALNEQLTKERDVTQEDQADFERVRELFKKGVVPVTRIQEARHLLVLSSTNLLQTRAAIALIDRERSELGRRLQRVDDQRRLDVLREMQDANVKLANVRSRLQSVSEKLAYTGMIRSQLLRGKASKPNVMIVRRGEGGPQSIPGNEETELQPGDVVEVALRSDGLAEGETQ